MFRAAKQAHCDRERAEPSQKETPSAKTAAMLWEPGNDYTSHEIQRGSLTLP